MVIGKMQFQRTLVIGLNIVPASHLEAWAGDAIAKAAKADPRVMILRIASIFISQRSAGLGV